MGEHASYHEGITGDEAKRRLKMAPVNSNRYLTRYSDRHKCYVLSVLKQRPQKVLHFRIVIEDNRQLRIDGKDRLFHDISSLLKHYEENRIDPDLKTIGCYYARHHSLTGQ